MNTLPILNATSVEEQDDYAQSANTLFHFMKQMNFLESVLYRKALVPRYCHEDISYLNVIVDGMMFNEIAILQKCFCDIPLHKITAKLNCVLTEESKGELKDLGIEDLPSNDHTELYGSFAIAFSKKWGEKNNFQPIHYLNEKSTYTRDFRLFINKLVSSDEIPNVFAADILQRLTLIKPLRGKIKRTIDVKKYINKGVKKEVKKDVFYKKNFHDEQEWRFIPDLTKIEEVNSNNIYKHQSIIANPNLLNVEVDSGCSFIDIQSKELEKEIYKSLWLDFNYSDIRYIIVPDIQSRIDIINFISKLPDNNITESDDIMLIKNILISKVLVLDEIRKDW